MTVEELRKRFSKDAIREIVQSKQTLLVMPTNKVGKIVITCLLNGLNREELNYE